MPPRTGAQYTTSATHPSGTASSPSLRVGETTAHTKLCPRCEKSVPVWTRSCTSCGWCFASAVGEPPKREANKPVEVPTVHKGKRVRAPTVAERHAKALARQACARAAKEEGVTLLGEEDPYTRKGKARKPLDEAQGERLLASIFSNAESGGGRG